MGRIATRRRDKNRSKAPTFTFTNRVLQGVPPRDSESERAEKDRKIAEYLAKKGKGQ